MKAKHLFLLLAAAALLLRFATYIQSCRNIPVTTDEAITVLQGKRILEGDLQALMYAQPYMIPFEAYLMAPLTLLPRTTWAMRSLVVMEGLVLLGMMLYLVKRFSGGTLKDATAGWLLLLFPSAYVVINTFGYSFPHNNSAMIFSLLVVMGMVIYPDCRPRLQPLLLLGTGLFAGLAFSNAMLTLVVCVPALVVLIFTGPWLQIPLRALPLAAGGWVGLFPYLYTLNKFEGAHQGVSGSRPLDQMLTILQGTLRTYTLPRVMGFGVTTFPDESDYPLQWPPLLSWLGTGLLILMGAWLIWRIIFHVRTLLKKEMPTLDGADFILGVWLANLLAFSASTRSSSSDFRYLMPMVATFPLGVAYIYGRLSASQRKLILVPTGLWAAWNVSSLVAVLLTWGKPGYAENTVNTPDLSPALNVVRSQNISHVYAQHWTAYRINFITDEEILCSQPYNARFPTWPLPYKETVDAAEEVAFVLTERNRFLTPSAFRNHLERMDMNAASEEAGHYVVFYDFSPPSFMRVLKKVPAEIFAAIESEFFRPDLRDVWTDLDLFTKRHSLQLQQEDMFFTVTLTEPQPVAMIRLNHGFWKADSSPAIQVEARIEDTWVMVMERGELQVDPFSFRNGHPVYGGIVRRLNIPTTESDQFRITLLEPNPTKAWTLSEFELYRTP